MIGLFLFLAWAPLAPSLPARAETDETPVSKPAPPPPDFSGLGAKSLAYLAANAKNKDPQIRLEIAAAWGEIGNPAALAILRRSLKDPSPAVRVEAAYSMHRLGDSRGLKLLEELVVQSTVPAKGSKKETAPKVPTPEEELRAIARDKVRTAAIARLAEVGGVKTVTLFEAALNDPSGPVRDATAIALVRLGFAEFADGFIEALKSSDDKVRAAAAKALWQTGTALGAAELEDASRDDFPAVRAEAMRALGNVPDTRMADLLARGLRDENLTVRSMALQSLARIPGSQASRALKAFLETKPHHGLAMEASASLARRGETADLGPLEKVFDQGDSDLQLRAVDALKSVRGDAATVLLQKAFTGDYEPRVRLRAAAYLVTRLQKPGAGQ